MMRRRGKGTNSTMPIILMIAFLLAVLVGLAILLVPEKDPAPPASAMRYETRPKNAEGAALPLAPYREDRRDRRSPRGQATDTTAPEDTPEEEMEGGNYTIRGVLVDGRTQKPVPGAYVLASRIPTEVEEGDFHERNSQLVAGEDDEELQLLLKERKRLWADRGEQSDGDGRFEVSINFEGDYQITVSSQAHLKKVVDKHFVGETAPQWDVTVSLETGATISGRIYDGFDSEGIPDIMVVATLEGEHYQREAQTDDEGHYEISGLGPGEFSIIANIERTAYRVTKELPFKRTKITEPDQAIDGVDFKLDRGGVVWGYITTPDNEPIRADVVLCTSESVLTQALSAMVRQAPPLYANSDKDGYYELVGVPLNEPWRLYATADENAPQLADSFLLTDKQKEARVDIFMFTGTNVYGQVIDSEGVGVPQAKILCIPGFGQLLAPMDSPQAVRETQSDDEGYFEVRELPVGSYQVMAQKDGYKLALRGEPLYSDGYHEIKNFRVVLDNIESGKYSVFGTVMVSGGSGLSGARVTLSGLGTDSFQGVGRETQSGGGGAFEFEGVEMGTYMLRAEYDGYSPKTLGRVLFEEPNTIIMKASATVRGRVLIKRGNQPPENGYTVSATLLESGEEENDRGGLLAIMESAATEDNSKHFDDPQGNYDLELSAGTWRIEGRANGLTPARKTVTLSPGEVLDDIDLLLSEDGGVISGRITVSDGSSPRGALVSLIEASSASQALSSLAAGANGDLPDTHVDEDGAFTFERLPEGTYHVIAQHPAYPQAMSDSVLLEADGKVDGVEVRLGPGGTLEGYVYRNGRPIQGTVVTLIAGGAPHTGTSDEAGYYVIRNIPSGEYEVFTGDVGNTIIGDSVGGQSYPVIIEDGLVTRQNFGDSNGVAIEILVAGRRGFIAATLNPPGAPVFQGDVELSQLSGYRSYVYGDTIKFEDIPIGEWQLDIYTGTGLTSTTLNWVGTELLAVTGEEPVMSITVGTQ